jgi:oligopeptide/dipeptide ABC transporter ATP-binding protein
MSVALGLKPEGPEQDRILEVTDLHTVLELPDGAISVVNSVSLHVNTGETLGIVGESGCGKSMTALSLLRLLPKIARIDRGSINFQGIDIVNLSVDKLRQIRGNEMSMIFQEPMTSLNPLKTIGSQISESVVLHMGLSQKAAMDRAVEMLELVMIPEARRRAAEFPHQMSGGMRQRVMIAMALCCNPKVLLADEPTTALDVTIQAQIIDLIGSLQDQLGTATILISHDLGLMAEQADRIMVMYAGRIVEESDADGIFAQPCHPYSIGLLGCIPKLGSSKLAHGRRERLQEIRGNVPSLLNLPKGCSFQARCAYASEQCQLETPPLEEKLPGHRAACWHSDRVLDNIS